jgi:alpha-beta hydrolase superfamily lysophospholipase
MRRYLDRFSFQQERLVLESGKRFLSAVYVSAGDRSPVFRICHGIGERVEYWSGVQRLLREMGTSSLVFNYTGFGASRGRVRVAHCEEDVMAAWEHLIGIDSKVIFLVGFSLGTGIAAATARHLRGMQPKGIVLCEGFSSLRKAALAAGLPRWLTSVAADIWSTEITVCDLKVPVLVVHSDGDRLFPLSMARRVADACGERGEMMIVNGLEHNEPIFFAPESYWGPIVEWAKRVCANSD